MSLNPYASFLGSRNPLDVITETPRALAKLVDTLGEEGLEGRTAPGKWTAREIICHLADTELAFAFRLRQALAEQDHVIQPLDQDRWATHYAAYDTRAALAVFSTVRDWNIRLIRSLPREAFLRKVTHPERGEMTFQTVVETMGGHDLNHQRQIETIASHAASA